MSDRVEVFQRRDGKWAWQGYSNKSYAAEMAHKLNEDLPVTYPDAEPDNEPEPDSSP